MLGNLDGKIVFGYLEELNEGVSKIEIFVVICVYIDNWCWVGVFFYFCIGKCMKKCCVEIVVEYKKVLYNVYIDNVGNIELNCFVICL